MKQLLLFFIILCLSWTGLQAQTIVEITSDITVNTNWTSDKIYVLKGTNFIYVRDGAILTIAPGTLIKGDPAALIITRGCKIIADGTINQPIIFTSNQPAGSRVTGDWGGIGLLGYAKVNAPGGEATLEGGLDATFGKYGGNDDADNSGILRYVRIEFAGIAFQPNNEINSLTMGGVGSGTVIDHVQTSYGGDDAYEWFGGTVNGKYMVAFRTVDDMFDTDFGYSGKNQFVLGISDPNIADVSGSNGFESDNDASGSTNTPQTSAIFSNVTIIGPKQDASTVIDNNFKRAMHIRRNSVESIRNSVFTGFPTAVRLESAGTEAGYTSGLLTLQNNIWAGNTNFIDSTSVNSKAIGDSILTKNQAIADISDLKLSDPFNLTKPTFLPTTGSPALTGANFTGLDPFFTKTTYVGAFGANDWTRCWTEFDPQNAAYDQATNYVASIPSDFGAIVSTNTVSFTAPVGSGWTYLWNFGDFVTSTEANPSHTYQALGDFTATLVVTTSRGCTKTITKIVSISSGTTEIGVNSNISTNTTWTNDNIYRLTGSAFLYVTNNSTLTIEAGTIIKGDPTALIITRGSKIIAIGTEEQPIVFTSAKAAGERANGDWGGIGLLGKATVNAPGGEAVLEGGLDGTLGKYGGNDDADNSGILKYVRIEFAGIAFQPNNEINSLTMGGVGSGTTIEHVQTSYGGDDAFEWFGGTVNSKYIIAYRTVDDMFDTDFGYSGKNQFVLGISDPNIADVSGSNGFESDNDAQGSNNNPLTNATFVNVSLFGPIQTPGTVIDANFRRSIHIRRNSQQDLINSVFTGFPSGLRLESNGSESGFLTGGTLRLRNNVFAGMTKLIDSSSVNSPAIGMKLLADGNSQINAITDLKIANPFDSTHPDFRLGAGSQLLSGTWNEIYADQFFTQVTFRGAFDAENNWTKCWAEFDPNNANYDLAPINYFADAPVEFLYTTQAGGNVSFTGPQGNGLTYAWDFGDGSTSTEANPVHKYAENKTYQVKLLVTNERGCARDLAQVVSVSTGTRAPISFAGVALAPNPANMSATLSFDAIAPQNISLRLLNLDGKMIHQRNILTKSGLNQIELNTTQLNTGLYLLQLRSVDGVKTIKLEVIR